MGGRLRGRGFGFLDHRKIGDHVYKAVLDTGARLSIVARRLLKQAKILKTKTVAIRVEDG